MVADFIPEQEGADLLLLQGSEVRRGEVLTSKQAYASISHKEE